MRITSIALGWIGATAALASALGAAEVERVQANALDHLSRQASLLADAAVDGLGKTKSGFLTSPAR